MSTQLVDNFSLSAKKFLDNRQSWTSLDELQANTNVLMPNGFLAYCKAENKWYIMSCENENDPSTYQWSEYTIGNGTVGNVVQVATLPVANAENKNRILQYIGKDDTDLGLVKGYWYKCTMLLINDEITYKWLPINVQHNNGIDVFKSNEEHKKDCYYLYNNYVYVCITDNKDSDFIEANYKKVGDELTLYDKQMIEEYIGLSQEELETINNLIEDDAIKVDKTHSSSKIYTDIQQCLKDSKEYTLKEIAKKVGTNYKIVESEDKVTSTNCLYLVGNETNGYKIYAYVDKIPKKLSDSIITLEGYAKEEELTTHINNNVAHLTAEEQTIVGKLGDENGSLTYDTKTISTINDTQASDKETYSSNKINALIQENKTAEISADKVKMADNTTVEDNITGLKYSFNKGYKTLKCDFKNKKIDDTGAEVDSTTTIITDKLSLDEYKSVEISCTGKYKLMVFKYNADDSFNSKIANTVSSFTINVVKGCKYIIQFWKNGDTNLKDALLRTTIKGEIEADENAKNIIAEIYNEFNNGVRELLYNREPYYLATDYGISTENDNNSQALQALMDYVYSNGGGTILYPNGDYKYSITETTHNYAVCLKPGVSIVGEDKYLTRFIMNDCNGKAYSLFWRLIGANSPLANAHFEKFTVDGSALTTWGVEGKAFYAQYVKHCVFKDLYLEGTPATALGVDFLDDVTIDHVTCKDCGRLWTTGKTGSAGIGIGTGGYENENFIITNNIVIGGGQYGIFVESQKLLTGVGNYESSKGMIIANNTVRNGLNNGIGVRNVKGITITGNTVYENANNGIYIEGGTDITIGCNTIFDNTANGINIITDDKFKNCNNVGVSGNTINKNGVNGILIDNTSTSLINNNISITGNQTSDNTEKGISLTGAIKNLYVNGNAIFDSIENNATVTGVNTVQTA